MTRSPQSKWRTGSALITRPDHVHAIGMVTIELANLEIALGGLLGALLHVSPDVGRLVYLTPRTGFGRIAVIENLVAATLREGSKGRRLIDGLLERSKAIMGKRHNLIHGAWGVPKANLEGEVHWHDLPYSESKPPRPVPLEELTDLVGKIQELTEEVRDTVQDTYQQWPPYSSRPKPRAKRRPSRHK